ncbi:MAG: acyl carrier protein [Clostridia bacterium]|nr:acyl carrier protein [Clostridia bacterium]
MELNRVCEIIADQFGLEKDDLNASTTFESLNADSIDIVELIMALEEEFDMPFNDDEIEKIKTIGDVVACLKQ